jgi:hypothetical protein
MEQEQHSNVGTEDQDALDFGDDYDVVDETTEVEVEEPEETEEVELEEGATSEDESTEEEEDEPGTVTIDGKRYDVRDLSPELVKKMATHYNQVGHFQKIAEERDKEIAARDERLRQLEQQSRQVMDEWTAQKMRAEQARLQDEERKIQQAAPPRPSTDQLATAFKPYLDKLAEDGRLTVDEVDEHSGLVAEYLYDTYTRDQRTSELFNNLTQRLAQLEEFVSPAVKSWDEKTALERDGQIRNTVSKMEGYEELSDPQKWEELKGYVTRKILNSPKDSEGNPLFDPIFDAETMAEQWDAMQGKVLRKTLNSTKKKTQEQIESDRRRAAGSASTGGAALPRKKGKRGPTTPEEDALDFTDNRRATA